MVDSTSLAMAADPPPSKEMDVTNASIKSTHGSQDDIPHTLKRAERTDVMQALSIDLSPRCGRIFRICSDERQGGRVDGMLDGSHSGCRLRFPTQTTYTQCHTYTLTHFQTHTSRHVAD